MKEGSVEKIKEIFIALLTEMPVDKITVTALCAKAQINRGTFYRYYQDIYAVLEDLEDGVLMEAPIYSEGMSGQTFLRSYLAFLKENKCLLTAIFSHTFYGDFATRLTQRTSLTTMDILRAQRGIEDECYAASIASYFFAGNLSLIVDWLKGELPLSTEEMTEFIYRVNYLGMNGILGDRRNE